MATYWPIWHPKATHPGIPRVPRPVAHLPHASRPSSQPHTPHSPSPHSSRQYFNRILRPPRGPSLSDSIPISQTLATAFCVEKMASCTAAATMSGVASLSLTRSKAGRSIAAGPRASFAGLRRATKVDSLAVSRCSSFARQTAGAKSSAKITCAANTSVIISLSTAALLALGRFVFLPFQRDNVARQGLPEQNGVTHFEAGDTRAQEAVSFLKTNDPAGFTIVDVLAWGALGHAVGFFVLATFNNDYNPQF